VEVKAIKRSQFTEKEQNQKASVKVYFKEPNGPDVLQSCRLGSFFCFLVSSGTAFDFLGSLLLFLCLGMRTP
jgi:hypothetical protein